MAEGSGGEGFVPENEVDRMESLIESLTGTPFYEVLPWKRVFVADGRPSERCGLTFTGRILDEEVPVLTCWRESWRNHKRCVWHANVENKPVDELAASRSNTFERLDAAILRGADLGDAISFANCSLYRADLTGVDINGAELTGADLTKADLSNANLRETDLTNTTFRSADLAGADFLRADLTEANLFLATLTNAEFRSADLTDADFRRTDLTGVAMRHPQIGEFDYDEWTTFGGRSRQEHRSIPEIARDVRWYLRPLAVLVAPFAILIVGLSGVFTTVLWTIIGTINNNSSPSRPSGAELQYRATQSMLREDERLRESPELDVWEKDARRRRMRREGKLLRWLALAGYRWTTLYGESPWRVVYLSFAVVAGSAWLFPRLGGTTPEMETVWDQLYFSVVTFTTLGYGDYQPATEAAQRLAAVEAFVGALLMALLVAVLARRITR